MQSTEIKTHNNLWIFFAGLGGLALVQIILGFVTLPASTLPVVNGLIAALFLTVPILSIFFAADHPWTPKLSLAFLLGGLLLQFGLIALDWMVLRSSGAVSGILGAVSQLGLSMWCVGLGALLATLIKDKNILVPIAVFLALYDAFLVLTPVGFTNQIMTTSPQILQTVGKTIPKVESAETKKDFGKASVGAYVGPADLVFLGTFFIALFRFRLQTKRTLNVMIPTLLAYLFIVLIMGVSLPALVPIGLVILASNWQEFRLSKDETMSTVVIVILGIALLVWAMLQPAKALPKKIERAPSPPAVSSPAVPGAGNRSN